MPATAVVLSVLTSPPSGPPPLALLVRLISLVASIWACAPTEPLWFRTTVVLELVAPHVDPQAELVPVAGDDLASLRRELGFVVRDLEWAAKRARWWPVLSMELSYLLADLDAHLAQRRAA